MISVITATGDRPETFDLCQKWMAAQTVQPDQWIVVDDGKTPMASISGCDYIRRELQKSDPLHTMLLNIKTALPHVKGDSILFWEDDEYYAPAYIEEMNKRLKQYEIVGIGRSKYYHFPASMYLRHDNMGHASLAQTAFNSSFLPSVNKLIAGDMFLDIRMWEKFNGKDAPLCADTDHSVIERKTIHGQGIIFDDGEDNCLYVGIKGLPGRKGIGSGHRDFSKYISDSDGSVFKKWIPKDHKIYADSFLKIPLENLKKRRDYTMNYRAINNGGFIPANSPYKSSVYGRINPGTVFEYDGPEGLWMQPIEEPEKKIIPVEELPVYDAAKKISESRGLPSLEKTPLDSKPKLKGKK